MKTSVKWMIGLGAAAVFCIVLACILFFSAINVNDIKNDVLNNEGVIFNESRVQDINLKESKPIEDIEKIEIDIGSGDVKILETEGNDFIASINGKYYNVSDSSERYKLELTKTGNTLTLKIKYDWKFDFGSFFIGDIKIEIPKTFGGALDLKIGSGSADFRVNNEFSDFKLNVSSGDININSIKSKGNSNIFISSGEITIGYLKALKADVTVWSGNLIISDCEIAGELKTTLTSGFIGIKGNFKTLNADITSGTAHIEAKELRGDYTIKVSSGDLKLTLPGNASYRISGTVSSGDVRDKKAGKWYYWTFSDGTGTYNINITVSSGYMEIS